MPNRFRSTFATFAIGAIVAAPLVGYAQLPPPGVPSSQPRPPVIAPPRLPASADPRLAVPQALTTRPSLQTLQQMLRASRTADDLRRLLAATPVGLRVERFCFVSGGHPAQVLCTSRLDTFLKDELGLSPTDQKLAALGLNDAYDWVGGNGSFGDLVACGGAGRTSVTDMLAMRRNRAPGATDIPVGTTAPSARPMPGSLGGPAALTGRERPGPAAMTPVVGADANALLGACRNRQSAGLRGGLGTSAPGDAGWERAVRGATNAMDMAVAQCRDDDKGLISDPGDAGGTTPAPAPTTPAPSPAPADGAPAAGGSAGGTSNTATQQKSPSEAAAGVAKTTVAIVDAGMAVGEAGGVVGRCTSPLKCAAAATVSVLGAVMEGAGLVTDNQAVENVGTATDIVGGLFAAAEILGGAAGASAALPMIGVITGSVALGSVVGEFTSESQFAKDLATAHGDAEFQKAAGAGGARRPAGEGGKPSCATVAARWSRFKEYCSQPGNDWRSYDCMRFVARMNGCADPGLVNPGPEGDYVCTAPCRDAACQAERRRAACELAEKRRGMISRPNPDGTAISCAARFDATLDLQSEMRSRICERATGEMGERCALGGPRPSGSTPGPSTGPRPVSPTSPRTP